jgi:type IV secretory pathway VirB6-like protein
MPLWDASICKTRYKQINSTGTAFIVGFLVTLFLLPCTIGPYVIASGLLSEIGFLNGIFMARLLQHYFYSSNDNYYSTNLLGLFQKSKMFQDGKKET